LCEAGFSAGDAVNALMTISYFTVGAVLRGAGRRTADGNADAQLRSSARRVFRPGTPSMR
ncbi:hypothetical protein CQA86_32425, partial [Klebsiella pneumoniae]